ncbi:hypothetical protein [Shewanella sairae]|nr:hypothetical protein [Shewanella sairae]MCL1132246.1 hypothetical protein [Shewanella sairae]
MTLCLSSSTLAMEGKVTFESGTASAIQNLHGKTITPEETAETWRKYAQKPVSTGSGGTRSVEEFSFDSTVHGTDPKKLRPFSTHICALGQVAGEYFRGLKAIDVRVQKNNSDGYWYYIADGYNSRNYGKAICWKP